MGLARTIGRVPVVPGLVARGLRALPGGNDPRAGRARVARLLATAAMRESERYGSLMEVFPAMLRNQLYTPAFAAALGEPRSASTLLGAPPAPGIAGLQLLDARTYLPDDLLVKADRASMARSLELRSPLLDHRVLELGVSLPDSLRFSGRRGKVALRRAFAHLLPARDRCPREDRLRDPARRVVPRAAPRARRGRAARRTSASARAASAGRRRAAPPGARARGARPRSPALVPARARAVAALLARGDAPGFRRIRRPRSMTRRLALAIVLQRRSCPACSSCSPSAGRS